VVQGGHCECRQLYFFNGKGNEYHQLESDFSYSTDYCQQLRQRSLLVIGCRIVQRGRWCKIIILKVYAPSEERSDVSKDSFAEELFCSYLIVFAFYQVNKCVSPQTDHHGHVI